MDCAWSKEDAQLHQHLVSLAQRECVRHRWHYRIDDVRECLVCGKTEASS